MKVAYYNFSKWEQDVSGKGILSLSRFFDIPYECEWVSPEEADLIIIGYGGNADHIAYITMLMEQYPQKKFIINVGEYLRRTQAWLPKKISTKATSAQWAKELFPYLYLHSCSLVPFPKIARDAHLYKFLYKHKNANNIFVVLCEEAKELSHIAYSYPIYIRALTNNFIATKYFLDKDITEQQRAKAYHDIFSVLRPRVGTHERLVFCSTIFGNTTMERVLAYKVLSKVGFHIDVYGENPISNHGKLEGGVDLVYDKSRFVLCFENSSAEGYITEKLSNAIFSSTIPIYWGATDIDKYVNKKSIIYCESLKDIRGLAKTVQEAEKKLDAISQQRYFLDEHIDFFVERYEGLKQRLLKFLG